MLKGVRGSLRRKLMLLVLATTMVALALSAAALVIYDLGDYERQWSNDLNLQAEILARASAPALQFNDQQAATNDLRLIRVRPRVLEVALYDNHGVPFATYLKPGTEAAGIPQKPRADGYEIGGGQIRLFRRVVENGEPLGTIYLRALYNPWDRLRDYLTIIGVVMVASLALAALLSGWLQSTITAPILEVARVARDVIEKRDYTLRAHKTTADEIGELVDSFNAMIAETGRRAEALRDADRRKDEFLATLAHELRNPLAPIRNAVEILRIARERPDMSDKAIAMMERQLNQMVRLVDDLLDVSRITTGKLAVRASVMELQAAVRDAIETVRPFLDSRDQSLDIEIPSEPIAIEGDRTRLGQVFANLLHNASKYSQPGAQIALAVETEGDWVAVRVRDSGIGLDARSIATIFDMFVQVDRSLTRAQAGLGVGLTLARRLVALHGGTIHAFSEGVGKGSEFVVRLPLAGARIPEDAAPKERIEGDVQARRILLADDNVDFANSLAAVLSSRGHDVRVARDGAEALRAAADFNPDFAFLDIGMPKVHGYEVARRLRSDPETSDCVLVAVTGWGQEDDRKRAREAGFDRHLVKPVNPGDIETILGEDRG
jgi:signal transduction histidine kinase/CheY-like chemotaxis protein